MVTLKLISAVLGAFASYLERRIYQSKFIDAALFGFIIIILSTIIPILR
jgi:hypothetical protein